MVNNSREVALFVDLENIATSMWKAYGQQPDPVRLVTHARQYGRIAFARVYADFTNEFFHGLESRFRNANIEPFQCPAKIRGDLVQSTVDMNVGIDMLEAALDRPTIDTFVLMAGDSDYVRVVARLRHRYEKQVVIAGIPGTVSRDLVEAAGMEDAIEAVQVTSDDEAEVIRILVRYEDTRYDGFLPTFRNAADYVKHPANDVDPGIVEGVMNHLAERGVLLQALEETSDGHPIRTTRLDRSHPAVAEALGGTSGG